MGLSSFVNRTTELATLEEWLGRPGSGLGIVFGRRRVGKTWLLTKFAEEKRVLRYTARGFSLPEEMKLLSTAAQPVLNLPRRSLLDRPFVNWEDVFEVLAREAETNPLLFIIDEFHELVTTNAKLEEELRAVWDRVGIGNTHLKFLVCGSSVRVMEALQEHNHAMFGRADMRLRVLPFKAHEAALMLPNAAPSERAAAWGVCGGIPRYLSLWDDKAPFNANVNRLICNEQGLLLSEGELVLSDEDIVGHRGEKLTESVLRAIASGNTTFSSISSAVGARLPTRVLGDLVDARLVEKVVPVTEIGKASKTTYYRIADNFLAFWLRCVEPYRSQIEQGLGNTVANVIIASFDDFMGARFESAFREYLVRAVAVGDLYPNATAVGEWWRTQGASDDDPFQLDAVILSGLGKVPVAVGEAKWAKKVNGSSVLGAMKRKLHESKLADPESVGYFVCARETIDRSTGITAVTARDIFNF